ncbi:MAG: M81 family metallopeptidase [Oscillospiraceae bacterium]|nr:M81 family metallopeptidase [Oscillospiraceae bacterium]
MKVLVGHFSHEANTFAEETVSFEQYTAKGALFGEDVITQSEGTSLYMGGIIKACREENIDMIPTCAYSSAAPVLTRECVDKMLETILPVCRAYKDELDGICMALHGAGVAEGIDDLELYVLKQLRSIVGDKLPIVVPMDLHGNVSEETAKLANGVFGIRNYPHTDKADISYIAMKTLARVMRKEIEIETKIVHLPLLIPISTGLTANAPFPEINAYMDKQIAERGLIYASLFQGFPYADVACSSASVCVVAEKGAREAAEDIAHFVWERRAQLRANSLSPAEAFDLAEKETKEGYIIINDMSDNPGGGCPGDGTHLLREMLKRNLPGSIFGFICDAVAAEEIWKHRPGEKIDLTLGGRHEKIFGEPLEIKSAEIISLCDGNFRHNSPNTFGLPSKLGKTARIRCGNVDIIVASVRAQTFDDRPFMITGADIRDYRYVCLKSTQHFRGFFGDKAAAIIPCDPPGLSTSNLASFTYHKIPRPVYPLDENVEF